VAGAPKGGDVAEKKCQYKREESNPGPDTGKQLQRNRGQKGKRRKKADVETSGGITRSSREVKERKGNKGTKPTPKLEGEEKQILFNNRGDRSGLAHERGRNWQQRREIQLKKAASNKKKIKGKHRPRLRFNTSEGKSRKEWCARGGGS